MLNKKTLLLGSLCFMLTTLGWAQRRGQPDTDIETYNSLFSGGVTTNTNSGLLGGAVVRSSKALPGTLFGKQQFRYLALEAVNVKHPKEFSSPYPGNGSRLIYGKQNYLFVLRPEYGRELMFYNRHSNEGISISGILAAGPSIGIEKPYYVQLQPRAGVVTSVPYTPDLPGDIIGAGSFFAGFDKAKLVPGLHIKAALSFELSAFRENMTGIEIGFITEAFSREIIIMPQAQNRSLFTSGFVTLYYGLKK